MRYSKINSTYHFEVDDAKQRIALIEGVLMDASALPQEKVIISSVSSGKVLEGTVADVFDRVIMRFAAKKADKWAWMSSLNTPKRGEDTQNI